MKSIFSIILFVVFTSGCNNPIAIPDKIVCEGEYKGHLQGVSSDKKGNIFWSFTDVIVKTDFTGKISSRIELPSHQGDLTWLDGKVYVAVNHGKFNEEPGLADSWIYVLNDKDLKLIEKVKAPELVHGCGGMAWGDGKFIVVGGLPKTGHTQNYLYEYNRDLKFVAGHILESGYTKKGIQSAEFMDGKWWFGTYDKDISTLVVDREYNLLERHQPDCSLAVVDMGQGTMLFGRWNKEAGKGWLVKAVENNKIIEE
jgi:hypothetical protein